MSVNILAVVGASAAFSASGEWYGVFGNQLKVLSEGVEVSRPPALLAAVELLRNLVVKLLVIAVIVGSWRSCFG